MNCCTSGDPVAEIGNNGDSAPWVTLDLFLGYGDIPGSGGGGIGENCGKHKGL